MYYQNQNTGRRLNFHEVRAHCLQTRRLFEDPEFPPTTSSLFVRASNRVGSIIWKRPFELVSHPKFYSDGVSRFDVIQGELGNCWFIAAVSNLTLHQHLFEHVVPRENTFEQGHYSGAFYFRFWTFGNWTEVVIDDRLPCNSRGELLFMQSEDKTEFWSCLLEKAYAKFHGSYESLDGGIASEALQDFSGGIVETVDIRQNDRELFNLMKKALFRQSLMTCALNTQQGSRREEKTQSGLVRGHAYSITHVQEIPVYRGAEMVPLIRIRNPWGSFEWNGPWSDGSPEWNMVDPSVKAGLGLMKKNDGEFWMSVFDFEKQFHRLEICHLSPDPKSDIKLFGQQLPWQRMIFEGRWIAGQNAGGCLNYSTFARNPQYFMNFEASDVDGDADKCTVVVCLIQRTQSRTFSRKEGVGKLCIGFRMFKVNQQMSPGQTLDNSFFKTASRSYGSGPYSDSREVSARFELRPGMYCIVPSTFEPDVEANFLLRIFSEPPPMHTIQQAPYNSNPYTQSSNPSLQYGQNPTAPPGRFPNPGGQTYPPGLPAAQFPLPCGPGPPLAATGLPPSQFSMPGGLPPSQFPMSGGPPLAAAGQPPSQFSMPGGLPPSQFPMPGGQSYPPAQFPIGNNQFPSMVRAPLCYGAPNPSPNPSFPYPQQVPPANPNVPIPGAPGGNIGWNL